MTWERAPVAAALAAVLQPLDGSVSVFAAPPETFNPPAFIVGYPRTVNYRMHFSTDEALMPVACACGVAEVDRVDGLLRTAYDALANTDQTLGGLVQVMDLGPQDNWRLLRVAGIDVIAADLVLRFLM